MKIFFAKLLLIEFETWCLLWLLRQLPRGKTENLPLDLELRPQERFCFSLRKRKDLSQNSSADWYFNHRGSENYETVFKLWPFLKVKLFMFDKRVMLSPLILSWVHHQIKTLLVIFVHFFFLPDYAGWRTTEENASWTIHTFQIADPLKSRILLKTISTAWSTDCWPWHHSIVHEKPDISRRPGHLTFNISALALLFWTKMMELRHLCKATVVFKYTTSCSFHVNCWNITAW